MNTTAPQTAGLYAPIRAFLQHPDTRPTLSGPAEDGRGAVAAVWARHLGGVLPEPAWTPTRYGAPVAVLHAEPPGYPALVIQAAYLPLHDDYAVTVAAIRVCTADAHRLNIQQVDSPAQLADALQHSALGAAPDHHRCHPRHGIGPAERLNRAESEKTDAEAEIEALA